MKEELISFKTAKLAKEKGFDGLCYDAYNSHGMKYSNGWCEYIDDESEIPFNFSVLKTKDYLAPTQSLLQKWLREKHDIVVWNKPYPSEINGHFTNNWSVYVDDFYGRHLITDYILIHGYEEALEKGLQEALKLI